MRSVPATDGHDRLMRAMSRQTLAGPARTRLRPAGEASLKETRSHLTLPTSGQFASGGRPDRSGIGHRQVKLATAIDQE
jgi:hypothetical protein